MEQGGFRLRKWVTNSDELGEKLMCLRLMAKNKTHNVDGHESYAKLSLGVLNSDSESHKVLVTYETVKLSLSLRLKRYGRRQNQ